MSCESPKFPLEVCSPTQRSLFSTASLHRPAVVSSMYRWERKLICQPAPAIFCLRGLWRLNAPHYSFIKTLTTLHANKLETGKHALSSKASLKDLQQNALLSLPSLAHFRCSNVRRMAYDAAHHLPKSPKLSEETFTGETSDQYACSSNPASISL